MRQLVELVLAHPVQRAGDVDHFRVAANRLGSFAPFLIQRRGCVAPLQRVDLRALIPIAPFAVTPTAHKCYEHRSLQLICLNAYMGLKLKLSNELRGRKLLPHRLPARLESIEVAMNAVVTPRTALSDYLQGVQPVARLLSSALVVALCACSTDVCASYSTQLDPPAPRAGQASSLTLSTVGPSYVYDFDVWPYAEFSGDDVTVNFLCQEYPINDPASSTASIGTLAVGHHTIHVWCWYDDLTIFHHEEVATLQVDVPAAEPSSVPTSNAGLLVAQAVALAMLAYLARRRKPLLVAHDART